MQSDESDQLCALILLETSTLYKLFTYLLTYLQSISQSVQQSVANGTNQTQTLTGKAKLLL